ncbi:hypothetical protein DA075_17470 [Methylobacterium currus]|uniref:DUF1640 domain-containing protein n=1 Tax=Methylobacterium currus TaxID=2051553 RepID=A0A2R4WLQ7_9HYPH|nr:hypothetical protein [Methylobacterium currus]AWB22482.1 hypothetical protein DA075_17470 [Methylobacterium currus]UHC17798.1 CCDC90 family protein [Methylobacterium currus]
MRDLPRQGWLLLSPAAASPLRQEAHSPIFAFDILKLARDLRENAAFAPEQAEGLAAAISSAVQDNAPAKPETAAGFVSVRSEITVLRTDLKMAFAALRTDASASQTDTRNEFAAIRSEMMLLEQRMGVKLGGTLAAFASILIAAMRLLVH